MDKITRKCRAWNMSRIKSKNTKPELIVRKYLRTKGIGYRINSSIIGKPDIFFKRRKITVFIHGCFWHGHGCKFDHKPKTNIKFWLSKIIKNKERDIKVINKLNEDGWKVVTLWECEIIRDIEKSVMPIMTCLNVSLR